MKYLNRHQQHAAPRVDEDSGRRLLFGKAAKIGFAVALALTVILTTCAMMLPALTATDPLCGVEEHIHTEACYRTETVPVCENTDAAHTHNDECFAQQQTPVCGQEAHTHTAACYEQTGGEDGKDAAPAGAAAGDDIELSERDLEMYTDFREYLERVGGRIDSVLYDSGNNLIDNIYEAAGKGYCYKLTMQSPYINPDTYYYYLPKSMDVDFSSKIGDISNGSRKIGSFEIADDSSFILFTFDPETAHYQSISGQITLTVSFAERIEASVSKTGWLVSPEGEMDGYFHFKISARIPADREGLPEKEWRFLDRSEITDPWVHDFGSPENAANTHVYISYGSVSNREIFDLKDVWDNEDETVAYYVDNDTKYLYLVNRCRCEDPDLCVDSREGACFSELLADYPDWGTCWCVDDNATVDIVYRNAINGADGTYILHDQNALVREGQAEYENKVFLTGSYKDASGKIKTESHKSAADIEFSAFLEKEETAHAVGDNGYTSEFRVTVNRQLADLSALDRDGNGEPDPEAVIVDEMSCLKYITGTMRISAAGADGESFELVPETDFTVDATRTETGTHLEIHLKKLGRYQYTLEYSTQVFSDSTSKTVEISNNVGFRLYDDANSAGDPLFCYSRRFSFDERWDFLRFEVGVLKVDYDDATERLPDAVFGLYTAEGDLIAQRTTDGEGTCLFATNVSEGLIFQTGTLYYLQEISAPRGYDLNTSKYWFYFEKTANGALEQQVQTDYPGAGVVHITMDAEQKYAGTITITNEKCFTLPETGGCGTAVCAAAGALLLAAAAVVIIIRKKGVYSDRRGMR